MFILSEMEKWRTPREMKDIFSEIYTQTASDEDLKAQARLGNKRAMYNELFFEYLPLMEFCELYFKDEDIECRYVGKATQQDNSRLKYDGEILRGDSIIKIEITAPRDGKKDKDDAQLLGGRSPFDAEAGGSELTFENIQDQILEAAEKKATMNYEGVYLVIYFTDMYLAYIDPAGARGHRLIEKIVKRLKKIEYSAEEVFLLLPPYDTRQKIFGGMIYKVK